MAEGRFYLLSDSFITDYSLNEFITEGRSEEFAFGWCRSTLAADEGPIYAIYKPGSDQAYDIPCHIVCNPVSKDFHETTEPAPNWSDNRDIVVMLVDSATNSYRIIIMKTYDRTRARREQAYLYASTTAQWRKLCEVPDDNHHAYSSILMNGVLYTLFQEPSLGPWCNKLYSCDTETGAWSYVDVELPRPSSQSDRLQVVACLGRLFCVEYSGLPPTVPSFWRFMYNKQGKIELPIKVRIWKILFANKERVKVADTLKILKFSRILDMQPQTVVGRLPTSEDRGGEARWYRVSIPPVPLKCPVAWNGEAYDVCSHLKMD